MKRLACLAGTALFLIGCQHTGTLSDDGLNARQRLARLNEISDWDMRGRLIVDDGERREAMRATWEQRGSSMSLTGRGAVGPVGYFRISGDADQLVIETSRSDARTLENPEIDLSNELGWWVPVTSLEYWLLGLADPDFPSESDRGPSGTLATLRQRDWEMTYGAYQLSSGLLVPERITLRHAQLELTMNISNWEPVVD